MITVADHKAADRITHYVNETDNISQAAIVKIIAEEMEPQRKVLRSISANLCNISDATCITGLNIRTVAYEIDKTITIL